MLNTKYYPLNKDTKEVSQIGVEAITRGGVLHIPVDALKIKPLPEKEGFAVVALADLSGTEYIADFRGEIIYNTEDGTKTKTVIELGEIETGYTLIKPLPYSTWSGNKWVQKIALIKAAKKKAVTAWRDQQESATDTKVTVDGVTWDASPESRTRLTGALSATNLPDYWTDADNNDQPITREILQQVNDEITELGFVIHARQRQMKKEIENLTQFDDVENYVIGWAN